MAIGLPSPGRALSAILYILYSTHISLRHNIVIGQAGDSWLRSAGVGCIDLALSLLIRH